NDAGGFWARDFKFLHSLHLYIDQEEPDQKSNPKLDIVLHSSDSRSGRSLHLQFKGVQELAIPKMFTNARYVEQVCGFQIFDISDRKLETAKWMVHDFEGGVVSFMAGEVEVVSLGHGVSD